MKMHSIFYKTLALVVVIILSSCAPASLTPLAPQVLQVEHTRIVTSVQSVEVTRLEQVLITNTPTPTFTATPTSADTPTSTRQPTATVPWDPPRVEVVGVAGSTGTICYYGPSEAYLYKVRENNGIWMRALGRNEDGTWLIIDAGPAITNLACWMKTSNVKFLKGSLAEMPVTWLGVTGSVLYPAPKVYSTSRDGNEVTITWQPIWMTDDDYNGYLIEAWVCQGGALVFRPIGKFTSYTDNQLVIANKGAYSVKVIDEPGCTLPSRARIYAVEKHGYTNYNMLPWPQANP
jgi:hypothetical protein